MVVLSWDWCPHWIAFGVFVYWVQLWCGSGVCTGVPCRSLAQSAQARYAMAHCVINCTCLSRIKLCLTRADQRVYVFAQGVSPRSVCYALPWFSRAFGRAPLFPVLQRSAPPAQLALLFPSPYSSLSLTHACLVPPARVHSRLIRQLLVAMFRPFASSTRTSVSLTSGVWSCRSNALPN